MAALSISRRSLLLAGGVASLTFTAAPGAWGAGPGRQKLVIVILRGAMDGMAMLPKVDDPDIDAHRGRLIDREAVTLGGGFALHSAMPGLAALYREGQAAFAPAAAGPYRERSHFEAQDLLESGTVSRATSDGWLNRALQSAPGPLSAVSIGPVQPLVLRGEAGNVTSWSPPVLPEASPDTLTRLLDLYEGDTLLQPSLAAAVKADAVAAGMAMDGGGRGGPAQYPALMEAAARIMAADGGPDIAVVSLEGWDTHASQNGPLQQRFSALDKGLGDLRKVLGPAWETTAIVMVSEFGRTVRENGVGGTDHGTAGVATLVGGAIRGGRMLGDWPGLAAAKLYENRDLRPTVDNRALFKGLLRDHMGWDRARLDTKVFPDSAGVPAMTGLVGGG